MGVTVNLSTDQKHYVAGDVVEGVVNLIIDAVSILVWATNSRRCCNAIETQLD